MSLDKIFDLTGGVYINIYIYSDYRWILVFIAMVLEYDSLRGEALILTSRCKNKWINRCCYRLPAWVGTIRRESRKKKHSQLFSRLK